MLNTLPDKKLLSELCEIPGVSGDEGRVRDYILEKCRAHADGIKTDSIGNLMVFKKGKTPGKTRMLCAHMDEVGLIVKKITDDGYLKFACVGGLDPRVLIGRRMLCGKSGVNGVIGIKAVHLTKPDERKSVIKPESMYIDIGALNKEDALKYVSPGDFCSFFTETTEFGDGRVSAKALDDRVGCAIMLELLKETPHYDTWFAFVTQEEVGARGSAAAAYALKPDECVVIEGTTCADVPASAPHMQVCRIGGGPVIPYMDRSAIADARMFDTLRGIAESNSIPWQTKELISGGTDAGRIHLIRAGIPCAIAAVPVRYIHSGCTSASYADIAHTYELCHNYLVNAGL